MSDSGCGFVRAIRAAMLASVMVAIALASHELAGGHLPQLWAILPTGIVALAAALLATRVRTNFLTTFGLVGVAQFGFHFLAEWSSRPDMGAMHHMAEHSAAGTSMPVAHLAAAAVSAGIITYGDRVLWTLGEWLSRQILLVSPDPLVAQNYSAPFVFTRSVPTAPPGAGALARRGPPLNPAFA